jgi:hypothetical protein
MNSSEGSRSVTLQLYRTPAGVKAIFGDNEQRPPKDDLFLSGLGAGEQAHPGPECGSEDVADHFLSLRKLAEDLYDVIALQGAKLGWTTFQIAAFQAPVARIRDAAQDILDKRRS